MQAVAQALLRTVPGERVNLLSSAAATVWIEPEAGEEWVLQSKDGSPLLRWARDSGEMSKNGVITRDALLARFQVLLSAAWTYYQDIEIETRLKNVDLKNENRQREGTRGGEGSYSA